MSGDNAKVLLVDDDKDLLQLIAMRLTAGSMARARKKAMRMLVSSPMSRSKAQLPSRKHP